jgi:hypothetical protein
MYDSRLRILDITDPTNPVEIGYWDAPCWAQNVVVAGNYVYVADSEEGLRVIDVSYPALPVEVGYYNTPGSASGVAVAESYAYVADGPYFGIYDVSQALGTDDNLPISVPQTVTLYPAYPNPFNPATTIRFDLPQASAVTMTVYNLAGQSVETLVDNRLSAGTHTVSFDGSRFSSGMYFCTLKAGEFSETNKMLLVK